MEKKELDRMEKYVRQDFERFNQIDLPYEKKAAAMTLKSYRDSLAYATEELNQLKKMYEADDLTEETEEIILQRTKNQVDRAKFLLEAPSRETSNSTKWSFQGKSFPSRMPTTARNYRWQPSEKSSPWN